MRLSKPILFLVLLLCYLGLASQVSLCSWNLQNFGKSKSDSAIKFIAKTVKDFDLVCIVEVVSGRGGAEAVARLADELNRSGWKWDYSVSHSTSSTGGGSERYACLWKSARLKKIGEAMLEKHYSNEFEREPYIMSFAEKNGNFTIALFHAIPKSKQPETEIKYLKFLPDLYKSSPLLFCGDFNCPPSNNVFNPLKSIGYLPALQNQKTTLKTKCVKQECLASEFDNVFFPSEKIKCLKAGVIEFYRAFSELKEARRISDHLPVYIQFQWR